MNTESMKTLFSRSLSKKKWAVIIASFVVFAATLSILFYEGTKKTVALTMDGKDVKHKTHADTVAEALKELDIHFRSEDYISHSLDTKLTNNLALVWKPAKEVALTVDEKQATIWTTANTVEELLRNENIQLDEKDRMNVAFSDAVSKNMHVRIDRAYPIELVNGADKMKVWSTSTTVADFLKQHGVFVGKLDRVEPGLKETIKPGSVIKVIRIKKVTDVVEEPIDFAVVAKKDPTLAKGQEKVIQPGRKGLLRKQYEVTKENGKIVARTLKSETKLKESRKKIVAVGTKVMTAQASRGTAMSTGGGNEFYVSATAYTASCNGCSGITATGINLKANPDLKVIAVDPNVIPLGSKVWVEGYGYAVAGDTGGAIKGNRIDLFVPDKQTAYRFGTKRVKIRVLN